MNLLSLGTLHQIEDVSSHIPSNDSVNPPPTQETEM